MKFDILLDTIEKVKNFVNTIILVDCDADLISGRYTIDAKSIMGIFSIDVSKPITLVIHGEIEPAVLEKLKIYQA